VTARHTNRYGTEDAPRKATPRMSALLLRCVFDIDPEFLI
jgi:hypothetical protein